MDFSLSEEQRLLAESVARFLEKEYPFEKRRALIASELGFSRDVWRQFAELGWLGIGSPEEAGGLGGGAVESAIVMEGIGRHLVVEPYFSTVILGAGLLRQAGPKLAPLLAELGEGRLMLALAHTEPKARFDLAHVETRAERAGGSFKLSGHKAVVLGAASADHLIVSARTSGAVAEAAGITLFLVPKSAGGLSLLPYRTACGQRAAEVKLAGVVVEAGQILGALDGAAVLLERTAEEALVALAAEAVGAMAALLAMTREYLKTRKQFGVPIGSFQVLQHRLVDMFMAHELARSTSEAAARVLGDAASLAADRARMAAAAKVQAGRAGRLVGQEAVQLHGGMGMTDELAVGHYFKRLTMIDAMFGNADHHQRRFAELEAAPA
ncbi:MAG TPA: acyl-CoA dehydrogenase family protein [Alphaproteobacteria bacterium]|nr:acyl-CoA dehydrogenase family protein [Alphaproteobacteria bacterium]